MALQFEVRNTFIHFVEEDAVSEDETSAVIRRSAKRPHTVGAEGLSIEEFVAEDCDLPAQQRRISRTKTYDPWEESPLNSDEDSSGEDCELPTPRRNVSRTKTFDPWEAPLTSDDDQLNEDFELPVVRRHFSRTKTFDPWEEPMKNDDRIVEEMAAQDSNETVSTSASEGTEVSKKSLEEMVYPDVTEAPKMVPTAQGVCGPAVVLLQPQMAGMSMCSPLGVLSQNGWHFTAAAGCGGPGHASQPVADVRQQQQYNPAESVNPQVAIKEAPSSSPQGAAKHPSADQISARVTSSLPMGKSVACSYLAGGSVHVRWDVDSRRFAGHDTTVVSPAFSMDLPGFGPQNFKIVVHSATARNSRGGTGFRVAKGRGRIELKCDAQLPDLPIDDLSGEEYEVVVNKPEGTRLGVDLAKHDGEPWRIRGITSGLIDQWNREHPEFRVAVGDRIVEVNGVRGSAAWVREECARVGMLGLKMQRGKRTAPSFRIAFGVGCGIPLPLNMRGPVLHQFAEQSCCGLPRVDEEFDFLTAVDKSTKKVSIHIEVSPA